MSYNILPFFSFLQKCVSVQHAALTIRDLLEKSHFSSVLSNNLENLSRKSMTLKGFVSHQNSTIAWKFPKSFLSSTQIRIAAAHIDFPCLKIRQSHSSFENSHSFLQLTPYGNPLLQTFVDAPLAVAGQIFFKQQNEILSKLICSQSPVAIIPSLAIHLKATQDPSPETFWKAIYCQNTNFSDFISQQSGIPSHEIILSHLTLYDPTPPVEIGSWIQAPRLDDLSMVYHTLEAFLAADPCDSLQIVAFFDHEEVGSTSSDGAESSILRDVLEILTQTKLLSLINQIQVISLDVAHGLHPLFPEKHSLETPPTLGKGPCIKVDSNIRYAQNHLLSAKIHSICFQKNIPFQTYEPKSGKPSGSTIGPILSAKLSAPCIDLGIPILGMHANREIASFSDMLHTKNLLSHFFQQ